VSFAKDSDAGDFGRRIDKEIFTARVMHGPVNVKKYLIKKRFRVLVKGG